MSLVRSAGLQKFRQVVESLGGDAVGCARRVGLPVEALDTDELLVEDSKLAAVLEVAAADLGRPDLGLRVGQIQDLGLLGPLAVAIQHSPSVADALECTSRYLFVHARDHSVEVVEDPEGARGVVALRYAFPGRRPLPQATDMTVLFLHRTVMFLAGGPYGLKSVDLPHEPVAPRGRYEEAFGARVRFGRPVAVLRLPSSLLSRTLDGVDATVRGLALAFLSRQSPAAGRAAVTSRVRAVLDQSLGTGSTDLADVASVLAVHPRTLQRQLAAEDTSFGAVLDSVRRTRARSYLTTTSMPLAQVSNLVGFAEQAVLTRCAKRWWGRTPSEVRREARNPS
ncbi:AraC family transcriptional regulator ligand-binding domain-containing protein [Actinoplanes sp. NPDC049681]|uniref:AraC family transcriptional regulator n=1 Tax=Actinoplanes sp. NPDC049681 TaxID=3363905 RepID=UPI0037AC773A